MFSHEISKIIIKKSRTIDILKIIEYLYRVGEDFPDPYYRVDRKIKIFIIFLRLLKHTLFNRIQSVISGFSAKIWIVLINNKMIGIAYIGMRKHRAILHGIHVDKEYRGKGIGKKLIKEVIKSLKNYKINKLILYVKEDNIIALNLYKKMGFKKTSVAGNFIQMELDLIKYNR